MLVSVGGVCDATLNMRHMQVERLFLRLCEKGIQLRLKKLSAVSVSRLDGNSSIHSYLTSYSLR